MRGLDGRNDRTTGRVRARWSGIPLCLGAGLLVVTLAGPASAAPPPAPRAEATAGIEPRLLASMRWREVGPYRGGRSAAVAGIAGDPMTYYFGATGGGVWKTVDGGATWTNVSDGYFGGSIGAVAVAPSDPNVVYVGGGEKTVRGNVSHGDGMWKSVDAGKSWAWIGLPESRHIARVRVHPANPDLVYAAVLGHLFGPHVERGVYRSADGGRSWQRILFVNADAGAVDLVLDPANPRVVYASTWRVRRTPWSLESGGEGSALWKSTDGGDTWRELSDNPGMPRGKDGARAVLGIIGVTVSPSNPQNVYAIVEADEGGVFRSRDGGDTWARTSDSRDLRQRAWYYSRLVADPRDEDALWVLNVRLHRSKDGGKTFSSVRTPHSDNHDLWIAPDDPERMIESNDGGANVSFDGGRTWTTQANQPTAQMYRVSTDNAFPYRLLGGQQDNSAVRIRSRSTFDRGIGPRDFDETAGGESGYVVAHPEDPDLVFGGSYGGYLTMFHHRSEEFRDVNVWPDNPMGHGAEGMRYRFQWNFPLLFSPHDPETLYAASNVLFRTRDRGASWQAISPDLTRNDASKMGPSGGPITKDNTSVEYYGTIFAIAESPVAAGVLWAGSDDGRVHRSADGGGSWQEVTPRDMVEGTMVNAIDASAHDADTAYLAATRYKLDDLRPMLWRTRDGGRTWTRIDRGIPADQFTRAVRADPVVPGLLYAGTERGVWMSIDDGGRWQSLELAPGTRRAGLPIVPITDLAVKGDDLVAATQGRGYWILDDLGLLRQLASSGRPAAPALFAPEPAIRLPVGGGDVAPPPGQGRNPRSGAVFHFDLDGVAEKTPVSLEILDARGRTVRTLRGEVEREAPAAEDEPAVAMGGGPAAPKAARPASPPAAAPAASGAAAAAAAGPVPAARKGEVKLPARPAMNVFAWDLRAEPAEDFEGMVLWAGEEGELAGPVVPPGAYRAKLTVGGGAGASTVREVAFDLAPDPRSAVPVADLEAQYEFLLGIRDQTSRMHRAIRRLRAARQDLDGIEARTDKEQAASRPLLDALAAARKVMTEGEEALYQTRNRSAQDPLNFPIRLNDKWALLGLSAATGAFAPTAQAVAVERELRAAIDGVLERLEAVFATDLPAIEALAAKAGVPALAAWKE